MGPASHCFFTASPCSSSPAEACPTPGRNEEDSDGFRLGLIFFLPPRFPSRQMTSENACDPKKLSPFSFAASFSALASGQAWVIFSYKKKEGEIIIQGKKNRSRLRALDETACLGAKMRISHRVNSGGCSGGVHTCRWCQAPRGVRPAPTAGSSG